MIRFVAGRCPTGRALAFQVEPVPVSPAPAASIPNAKLSAADLAPALATAFPERLTVHRIQDEVAQFYGVQTSYMREPDRIGSREPRVSHPRQMAMALARELTKLSLPALGREFGGRDHTTVLYALKAVEKRAKTDPFVEIEREVLRERFVA
jgi:chromosomal replication initiation ATPase DnaA